MLTPTNISRRGNPMSHIINVRENERTYTAVITRDLWDKERTVVTLSDIYTNHIISVGDGADSYAALEDALWDALAEDAHTAIRQEIEATLSDIKRDVFIGRIYAGL